MPGMQIFVGLRPTLLCCAMIGIITEFVVVRPLVKSIAGIFGMSMS